MAIESRTSDAQLSLEALESKCQVTLTSRLLNGPCRLLCPGQVSARPTIRKLQAWLIRWCNLVSGNSTIRDRERTLQTGVRGHLNVGSESQPVESRCEAQSRPAGRPCDSADAAVPRHSPVAFFEVPPCKPHSSKIFQASPLQGRLPLFRDATSSPDCSRISSHREIPNVACHL